jgi:hypothetical protein
MDGSPQVYKHQFPNVAFAYSSGSLCYSVSFRLQSIAKTRLLTSWRLSTGGHTYLGECCVVDADSYCLSPIPRFLRVCSFADFAMIPTRVVFWATAVVIGNEPDAPAISKLLGGRLFHRG